MGACEKTMLIKTQVEKKMFKLYQEMVDQDRAYYGYDPYSGSWATIPNVGIVRDPYPDRKWTKKKYKDVWDWLWENTEKHENSNAIKSPKGFLVLGIAPS
jgi:hypothetical protein